MGNPFGPFRNRDPADADEGRFPAHGNRSGKYRFGLGIARFSIDGVFYFKRKCDFVPMARYCTDRCCDSDHEC